MGPQHYPHIHISYNSNSGRKREIFSEFLEVYLDWALSEKRYRCFSMVEDIKVLRLVVWFLIGRMWVGRLVSGLWLVVESIDALVVGGCPTR